MRFPPGNQFAVTLILADGSTYPQRGPHRLRQSRIQFGDRHLSLRATFDNAQGTLRPGQFVRARLSGAVRPGAILVPQRAVLQGAKSHFVWVLDADSKPRERVVEVGDWHGDDWFITQGLLPGERVVVDRRDPPLGRRADPHHRCRGARQCASRTGQRRGRRLGASGRRRAPRRRAARTARARDARARLSLAESTRTEPMNISHFCIDRPIFASVISIVITLGGALAMFALPIAQYPEITPPQITISANYPGASADVVAENVAAPIEQQSMARTT